MQFAADKVVEAGNKNVMITERGTTFGYQDLVVDYRGIPEMQTFGFPVILDVTHSLQQPNQTSIRLMRQSISYVINVSSLFDFKMFLPYLSK